MAAYFGTLIYGNEDFGGYLSIDGEQSQVVEHDMTYRIDPGPHHIDIYSTSDTQRRIGAFQRDLYNSTSSSGAFLDEMQRQSAIAGLGESWGFDVVVEDGQMLIISIRSNDKQLVGSPMYHVEDLSEEAQESLEATFAKLDEEEEAARQAEEEERLRRASLPRRRPGLIVLGAIMMYFGVCGLAAGLLLLFAADPFMPAMIALPVIFGILALFGLIVFINGMKKKIR